MEEIWKDIKGFEGLYQVSNTGKIKSFRKGTKHHRADFYILNPTKMSSGYLTVTLYRSPNSREKWLVHRLVATHFLPNPNNWPYINHIDEDKENNAASNLEWCTARYNNEYGTAKLRRFQTEQDKHDPVVQMLPNGKVIAKYWSAVIASKITGIDAHLITMACRGDCDSARGYCWAYINNADF